MYLFKRSSLSNNYPIEIDNSKHTGTPAWMINIPLIIGVAIILIIVWSCSRKLKKSKAKKLREADSDTGSVPKLDHYNPENSYNSCNMSQNNLVNNVYKNGGILSHQVMQHSRNSSEGSTTINNDVKSPGKDED